MKKVAMVLALIASLSIAGTAMAAVNETPDYTVEHDGNAGTNDPPFWEAYFEAKYPGTDWTCAKVNGTDDPVVLAAAVDALIIKAGTTNYVWEDAAAGEYSPPANSTSHWLTCDDGVGPPPREVVEPFGGIGGPCADPAYYGIFDNTESTVAVKFRFRWYTASGLHTVVKVVPAGAIYRTWEHWVKPFTTIRVGYYSTELGRWVNLDSETSVKGRYPACEYQRGFEYPNPA